MDRADRVVVVDGRSQDSELVPALSEAGFDVQRVTDADTLEAAIRTTQVDCVVSTYQVLRRDGLEFLGGLHALQLVADRDPDIPRILYTDIVNPDIAREAVSLGLFDYIPANTETSVARLVTRVKEATAKHRAERQVAELSRVNDVMREVLTVLIRAETKQDVYEGVTDTLVATEAYDAAWLGQATETALDDRAVAGAAPDLVADRRVADAGEGSELTVLTDSQGGPDRAIVPITDDGLVLAISTDRPEAFTGTEREVLAELGEAIQYSLDAITAYETLERSEAALEEKTERLSAFASVLGHDLRNPLNVAHGNLQLAMEGETDRLETVESALDRMADLVEDVLSLAREGDRSIAVEPVSLAETATEGWNAVETADATLSVAGDATVRADPGQLRRLFENLFRNAVEHGGPTVTVTVEPTESGFVVRDDGPGLSGTDDELFELGVTDSASGTGLGLAIVENIAAAHGWSVTAGTADGGGARFLVEGVTSE